MRKQYIASTVYYIMKLGEIKKIPRVSNGKRNVKLLKRLDNKTGTLILVNDNRLLKGN